MDKLDWEEAGECLRVLSHPHRLKVIHLLLEKDYSVGEIAEACGLLKNVASEHLILMKNKGFIKPHKRGRKVYYSIKDPSLISIIACVKKRFSKLNKEKS